MSGLSRTPPPGPVALSLLAAWNRPGATREEVDDGNAVPPFALLLLWRLPPPLFVLSALLLATARGWCWQVIRSGAAVIVDIAGGLNRTTGDNSMILVDAFTLFSCLSLFFLLFFSSFLATDTEVDS